MSWGEAMLCWLAWMVIWYVLALLFGRDKQRWLWPDA
jgi:hypothetical protein